MALIDSNDRSAAIEADETGPRVRPTAVGDPGTAHFAVGSPALAAHTVPDTLVDDGQVGDLTVRVASVRGASHRLAGTPRQDDVDLGVAGPDGGWLVIAVADGVSAGPASHVAARLAVRTTTRFVTDALGAGASPDTVDWNRLVGSIAGAIVRQARTETGEPDLSEREAARFMATTLAVAVVATRPDDHGRRPLFTLPLGDTSVWRLQRSDPDGDSDAPVWCPVTPVKGEGAAVAESATFALPLLPAAPLAAHRATLATDDTLFVMTDGMSDPLSGGHGPVAELLAHEWARPPYRYEFAAHVDLARRSHTDDRTVVAVWTEPTEPGPSLPGDGPDDRRYPTQETTS